MPTKLSTKGKTAGRAGRKARAGSPPVATPKAANVCDRVHRIIRLAKKETPLIKSLKEWYAENC